MPPPEPSWLTYQAKVRHLTPLSSAITPWYAKYDKYDMYGSLHWCLNMTCMEARNGAWFEQP